MSRRLREKTKELTDRFKELTAVWAVFIVPSWGRTASGGKRPEDRVYIFGGSKESKAIVMKEAVKSVRALDDQEAKRFKELVKHRSKQGPKRSDVQVMRDDDRRVALADENDCPHGSSKVRCETCTPRERRKAELPEYNAMHEVELDII